MTDIDIEELAKRLRMAKGPDYHTAADLLLEALAFKQEVSDAVEAYLNPNNRIYSHSLNRFIIPKPDPLVEVLNDMEWRNNSDEWAKELRAALEARGLEIRSKNDG